METQKYQVIIFCHRVLPTNSSPGPALLGQNTLRVLEQCSIGKMIWILTVLLLVIPGNVSTSKLWPHFSEDKSKSRRKRIFCFFFLSFLVFLFFFFKFSEEEGFVCHSLTQLPAVKNFYTWHHPDLRCSCAVNGWDSVLLFVSVWC